MRTDFLPYARLPELRAVLEGRYRVVWQEAARAPGNAACRRRAPASRWKARALHIPSGADFFRPCARKWPSFPWATPAAPVAHQAPPRTDKPLALVNLRPCDLAALRILDDVFLSGDVVDPFYQARRQSTLIVSVDCVTPAPTCFCHLVGGAPFTDAGMGLHLSPLATGYRVHADSDAGERMITELALAPPELREEEELPARRQAAMEALAAANQRFTLTRSPYTTVAERAASDRWQDLFAGCVECGACCRVCPTCYCFYLFDELTGGGQEARCRRCRTWDSCITADYARMAGPPNAKPNPRPRLRTRFANRFDHKYRFHYETSGEYACVGCGRCAEVCMARSDPREVLRVLEQ
ncbi:4Fe-4S dicluster domain-containing protein [bacterium]|nr:4Fe-4S dicluster domain-containing protein [bacterium]